MLSVLLSRQFRAYRNDDPSKVQQKAVPFCVLEELAKRQVSELDHPLTQLTISAGFFACRSCEYSRVPRRDQKRTKLLCLRNIRFFREGHLIGGYSTHDTADHWSVHYGFRLMTSPELNCTLLLSSSTIVSWQFYSVLQKNFAKSTVMSFLQSFDHG